MTVLLVILTVVIGGAYIYAIAKPLGDMADGWKVQEDWCRAERLRVEARTRGHQEVCAQMEAQIQATHAELAEIEAETAKIEAATHKRLEEVVVLERQIQELEQGNQQLERELATLEG